MPPTITLIGAGSTIFAKNLLGDILSFPELAEARIRLYDIDAERLRVSENVAHTLARALGVRPTILATTDRQRALDDADYVIAMIQVGGYQPATLTDFAIPRRYGLRQTIGDTLGIGGIMRALRTIPVLLDVCRDMEELCPQATLLNYVNPMAMICWALSRATPIRIVGLCHSVHGTVRELAYDLDIPADEIAYRCAGINHMAFYTRLERHGEDLYPRLHALARSGRAPRWNQVRYDMLQRLGFFVTESSEHFSEYVPWFIKHGRGDLLDRYQIPLDEYLFRCEDQLADWAEVRTAVAQIDNASLARLERAQLETRCQRIAQTNPAQAAQFRAVWMSAADDGASKHSGEYGSLIIHAQETGQPRVIYGNVPNASLIDNLPPSCCVEVPCLVDNNGVQPVRIGALPPQLTALMQTNINVQALAVEAALTHKREHIYHAAMLDPHTAAELDLDQIWSLVDDLLAAHAAWLPSYA
ncbi:alpha-glucosidase/alpha-galactosidase [Candidatus Gracilibacteria bacterium]|nr:alpha-glucosidase/alpha-galactosidase [Candidatus Gracilibacteria bacterium]